MHGTKEETYLMERAIPDTNVPHTTNQALSGYITNLLLANDSCATTAVSQQTLIQLVVAMSTSTVAADINVDTPLSLLALASTDTGIASH